jgi:3'-phosphoadenosine 5'-phosphosulfate sulfotransferase (PAPS reductase)/FAD synthetase
MSDIEWKVSEALGLLREFCKSSAIVALFSGGKDSLVSLALSAQACNNVIAVHADTTAGIPDNIRYVEEVCRKLGARLVIAKPRMDYFTLAEKWGFPRMKYRWCCGALKVHPIREKLEELRSELKNIIVVDGIRAEESKVRRRFERVSYHQVWGVTVVHPILHWAEDDVKEYIELYLKPLGININPLYKVGFRRASECWCPVFKSERDFELLAKHYPDFFMKLVRLERNAKSGFAYAYIKGRPYRLSELAKKLGFEITES